MEERGRETTLRDSSERFDAFGFSERHYDRQIRIWEPYYRWWLRVRTDGLEHVPVRGAALLVGNHCGLSALDTLMLSVALRRYHPGHRPVRPLHHVGLTLHPLWGHLARVSGWVPGHPRNGRYLLAKGELVLTYPEGGHSSGKTFAQRHSLCPSDQFGAGFVRLALEADVPVIPVVSAGFENAVPTLFRSRLLGRLHGMQDGRLPVSPQFLATLPVSLPLPLLTRYLPLPVSCRISIGEPIDLRHMVPSPVRDSKSLHAVALELRTMLQDRLDEITGNPTQTLRVNSDVLHSQSRYDSSVRLSY